MKSKLYLYAVSAFILGTVQASALTCPEIPADYDGKSNIGEWTYVRNKAPDNKHWQFYNAWIYDADQNQPAKCHYSIAEQTGSTLYLVKEGINTSNYKFENQPKYNTKHHGYHCKRASTDSKDVKDCVMIPIVQKK